MKQNKETIKTYFETGDKPTQEQYADLIDSYVDAKQPEGEPNRKFVINELGEVSLATENPIPEYTLSEIVANKLSLLKDRVVVKEIDLTPYIDDTNLARLISGEVIGTELIVKRDDHTSFSIDVSSMMKTSQTGLEKISENAKEGWRLVGKNPDFYGNIGLEAVDLSIATYQNTTNGATGDYSFTEGFNSTASGNYSHAEGRYTIASGENSHAQGFVTQANGKYSHAQGNGTKSNGEASHAQGTNTTASATASHAEGYATTASGNYSHAEGNSTEAIGKNSHAQGLLSKASAENSHAEGRLTSAIGLNSHAQGNSTIAAGSSSHSEGSFTNASGDSSYAGGVYNEAPSFAETAIGCYGSKYNATGVTSFSQTDRVFNIGIGSSDTNRQDALTVLKNGAILAPNYTDPLIDNSSDTILISKGYAKIKYGIQIIEQSAVDSNFLNTQFPYMEYPIGTRVLNVSPGSRGLFYRVEEDTWVTVPMTEVN